jgi:hypothetical protein
MARGATARGSVAFSTASTAPKVNHSGSDEHRQIAVATHPPGIELSRFIHSLMMMDYSQNCILFVFEAMNYGRRLSQT